MQPHHINPFLAEKFLPLPYLWNAAIPSIFRGRIATITPTPPPTPPGTSSSPRTGVSPANETPKINLFAMDSIDNFPGNSGLGPLIKKKTSMKGKYPDAAVGCGISGNYSFVNEISIANIQCMIHGRLVIYSGVMNFIHTDYHEFF